MSRNLVQCCPKQHQQATAQRENLTIVDTHSERRFGFFVLILPVNLFRFLRIVVPPEPGETFRQFRRCQRRVVRSAAKTKV